MYNEKAQQLHYFQQIGLSSFSDPGKFKRIRAEVENSDTDDQRGLDVEEDLPDGVYVEVDSPVVSAGHQPAAHRVS